MNTLTFYVYYLANHNNVDSARQGVMYCINSYCHYFIL